MPGRVWTRDKLVELIRGLHEQGVDLSPTAIQKTHSELFSSARSQSHFGSWRAAVQAAGLPYDEIKRTKQRWSREEILRQIQEHHARGEDLLNPSFKIKQRSLYLAACAHRYFGSWRRAIQAAQLDHDSMRETRVWTQGRIVRTIQDMARDGKPLGWAYIEEFCPGIYRAARRKENFGSWNNALLAAGVPLSSRQRARQDSISLDRGASDEDGAEAVACEMEKFDKKIAGDIDVSTMRPLSSRDAKSHKRGSRRV